MTDMRLYLFTVVVNHFAADFSEPPGSNWAAISRANICGKVRWFLCAEPGVK